MSESQTHTNIIERLLETDLSTVGELDVARAHELMRRALPPTRTLLVVKPGGVHERLDAALWADLLDVDVEHDRRSALARLRSVFYPIVLTDNLDLIRSLRPRKSRCTAMLIYLAAGDSSAERAAGLRAGADECIGGQVSEEELHARLRAARRIAELEHVLRTALDENHRLSAVDDLTRVGSKRFFNRQFARDVARAAQRSEALSLILCDIDHFKAINDSLGHAEGDLVLKHFAARLKTLTLDESGAWIARVGGEEFAIVLPRGGRRRALEVARRLRQGIAEEPFEIRGITLAVTASFGVYAADRVPESEEFTDQAIKAADTALYRSKGEGRNRVSAAAAEAVALELSDLGVCSACG